jgi:hypothetical protein
MMTGLDEEFSEDTAGFSWPQFEQVIDLSES